MFNKLENKPCDPKCQEIIRAFSIHRANMINITSALKVQVDKQPALQSEPLRRNSLQSLKDLQK